MSKSTTGYKGHRNLCCPCLFLASLCTYLHLVFYFSISALEMGTSSVLSSYFQSSRPSFKFCNNAYTQNFAHTLHMFLLYKTYLPIPGDTHPYFLRSPGIVQPFFFICINVFKLRALVSNIGT